jgi:hypothetical protein
VIEEIRKLMVRLATKSLSKGKLKRGEPGITTGKQHQQHQSKGEDGQLQEKVWDPGGSQQHSRGSHE